MITQNNNKILQDAIFRVLSKPTPTILSISLKLTSLKYPSYLFKPDYIQSLVIMQDFIKNYTDEIEISFHLSTTQYTDIAKKETDLIATLYFQYLSLTNNQIVSNPSPFTRQYRAMIVNKRDPERQQRENAQFVEKNTVIRLKLIEPEIYLIRHKSINGMFQSTSIDGLVRHMSRYFGTQNLYFVPPDNIHNYGNLVIPPAHGIDTAFEYVQKTWGVYNKGLATYFTGGRLYIYPCYENKPVFPYTAQLYLGKDAEAAGYQCFHKYEDPITEIVIDGTPDHKDLTRAAGENRGTSHLFMRSSHVVDGYSRTDKNGTTYDNNAAVIVRNKKGKVMDREQEFVRYGGTTDNIFTKLSEYAKFDTELLTCRWSNPVPFLLAPGHRIRYNYDAKNLLETTDGILEAVGYQIERQVLTENNSYSYNGSAVMRIRLEPSEEAVPSEQI